MVIGNNKYMSNKYANLSGAVADADHFEAYLRGLSKLDTDIIDIISLRNASRQDILTGFYVLQNKLFELEGQCCNYNLLCWSWSAN